MGLTDMLVGTKLPRDVMDAVHEAEVTDATACAIYQWLREVCTTHLLHTPIRLGGPGIVQIDESLLNHTKGINEETPTIASGSTVTAFEG